MNPNLFSMKEKPETIEYSPEFVMLLSGFILVMSAALLGLSLLDEPENDVPYNKSKACYIEKVNESLQNDSIRSNQYYDRQLQACLNPENFNRS